jgi:3-dehydroquinate synthase
METVTVELGERSYPVCIGAGTLGELGLRMHGMPLGRRAAVVTNPVVGALYVEPIVQGLEDAGFKSTVIEVPDGEEHKNLAWLAFLYDRLLQAHLDRQSPIIALGGGVVGDLAGFAAATLLRGVPLIQVPTTLLAQVDSSVGGKTAVNHAAGKNLIGAFYQPRLVWIDVQTLRTLPPREIRAGMAEVIKYAATLSASLFELLEQRLEEVLALDGELLVRVVMECCRLKAMVVSQDEREAGYRSVLNFGHTIGHAVEVLTEYRRYLHGEAVAIGMAIAARLSRQIGRCSAETEQRLLGLIERAGLPVFVPEDVLGPGLLLAIETDKKVSGGKIKFVCIEAIGRACFEQLASTEVLEHAGLLH